MVSDVKNVLTSAFLVTQITDDVIVTSRDVIMSDVRFFGLKSFLSLMVTVSSGAFRTNTLLKNRF